MRQSSKFVFFFNFLNQKRNEEERKKRRKIKKKEEIIKQMSFSFIEGACIHNNIHTNFYALDMSPYHYNQSKK